MFFSALFRNLDHIAFRHFKNYILLQYHRKTYMKREKDLKKHLESSHYIKDDFLAAEIF